MSTKPVEAQSSNQLSESPKLVLVSGHTKEAVQTLLKDIESHANDVEYLAVVNEIHTKSTPQYNYRGYAVFGAAEPITEIFEMDKKKRPIWFVYTGLGSEWAKMVKEMMQIEVFSKSIHRCAEVLRSEGIDLIDVVTNKDEASLTFTDNCLSVTATQIALTDILTNLGIIPDGIVGHSTGEMGCAYADGCLTLEQTILAAYWRGRTVLEIDTIPGMMAIVRLSGEECSRRLPEDIVIACYNSACNVTISGPIESVNRFVKALTKDGVFAATINVSGIAFHSKYIADAGPKLQKALEKIIPNPKNRSEKWISSSIPDDKMNTALAKKVSAAYYANNLLSPVLFHMAMQKIPKDAVCIEVAPHGLFQKNLQRSIGQNARILSLMKRFHENNREFLLRNIGKLYGAGVQLDVNRL